jgi:prepilin-type N-terminal cleavage/methylation domain-containing protein
MKNPLSIRIPGRRRPGEPGEGFTLIELLIVVSIICLLVTILMPAFGAIKKSVANTKCKERIVELATGATTYQQDNKGLLPGQWYISKLTQATGYHTNGPYSGSQVLAASLFGYSYYSPAGDGNNIDGSPVFTSNYAPCGSGDLVSVTSRLNGGKVPNCIWDKFSDANVQPILYYPSRIGVSDCTQYVYTDNIDFTSGTVLGTAAGMGTVSGTGNTGYIVDTKVPASSNRPTVPFNYGTFLLIAPGFNRTFEQNSSTVVSDDLHNWNTP